METCILEYLYYNNKAREIFANIKNRRDNNTSLENCLKEQGAQEALEKLTNQVTAMIDINKKEISGETTK